MGRAAGRAAAGQAARQQEAGEAVYSRAAEAEVCHHQGAVEQAARQQEAGEVVYSRAAEAEVCHHQGAVEQADFLEAGQGRRCCAGQTIRSTWLFLLSGENPEVFSAGLLFPCCF